MIDDLSLTNALGIVRRREAMGDFVLGTEGNTSLLVKFVLLSDMMVRKVEVTYEVLPYELDHLLLCDFKERYSFDPLGEIIDVNQHEPELRLCSRKWAHCVQPHCMKGHGLLNV